MALTITYTLGAVVGVSLLSLIGAATVGIHQKILDKLLLFLVALSAGALFGDAFFHILPELFAEGSLFAIPTSILAGLLVFFVLEKFLHWHHGHEAHECHGPDCPVREIHPVGRLVLVADALHNLVDGAIIAVAFTASIPVGIATTIAVAFHEIPQEISDFAILIHSGYTRARALFFNLLSGLTSVVGALLALFFTAWIVGAQSVLLGVAVGGFLYIAGSDLVPALHKERGTKASVVQFLGLVCGMAIMGLLLIIE